MYCLAAWGRNAEKLQLHFIQLPLSVVISDNVCLIPSHSLNQKMVERAVQSPDTGQEELHTDLSSPLFSQKITCPRTSLIVSFSQIGDPEGCPVLFIPPAVCSRWAALPLGMPSYRSVGIVKTIGQKLTIDQTCQSSWIKLIAIDRPGCGFTPPVSVEERLEISCSKPPNECVS